MMISVDEYRGMQNRIRELERQLNTRRTARVVARPPRAVAPPPMPMAMPSSSLPLSPSPSSESPFPDPPAIR
jgi:hypothetical protein